ncbi:MAG: ABC transporter permease [Chloroflexi bacterium]|nr:MAG: ABC transporter permease [Chloroflexota bacterium]
MRDYVIRRLLLLPVIVLGVTFLTFLAFRIIPGDVCVLRLGLGATPQTVHDCQVEQGLDKPWYEQYGNWVTGIAEGDFGTSMSEGASPVNTELDHRLPITIELMIMTMIFAVLLGIPPGVLSAIRPGTPLDWITRLSSVVWLSVPSFYLGIIIITFGSKWFNWTPPQFGRTYVPFMDDPLVNLEEFVFPALVLAVGIAAPVMRLTRSAMLEVMRNDYIRTAWSKGLRERTVVWRHGLKNALIPVVTVVGLQIGALISGAVLVESVFNLNGVGKYIVEAIERRDFVVVQSLVFLFAIAYVVANLLVDIAYAWLDPRIHYA